MPVGAFDIYQTPDGYQAVANPTRRHILNVLADGDVELSDLVKITGKAKPTLSSVHMRYLLENGLVAADENPDDHRRKVYHLIGRKIGSSDLPLSKLRDAVDVPAREATAAPWRIAAVIDTIAAAPDDADPRVLHAQACRFGALTSRHLGGHDPASHMTAAMNLLAEEDVARPLRFDTEARSIDLGAGPALPPGIQAERLADIIAGLVEGMGREHGWIDGPVEATVTDGNRRFRLRWD